MTSEPTVAQALVILPFADVARAESFVQMLNANTVNPALEHEPKPPGSAIVTLGTALEWVSESEGTSGQYIEFGGGWETYVDDNKPGVVILDRRTTTVEEPK